MFIKKMNEKLSLALKEEGLDKANALQKETFGTLKSGADCLIISPEGSGKTTTIVLSVIQQLGHAVEESPRALIMVQSRDKMLEMKQLFDKFGNYTDLRVYGVHDQGDIDYDKNHVSLGIDVLIGTPNKLDSMFSGAGYNVNKLRMFIIDDIELILKNRFEPKIARLSNSIVKTQRVFFSDVLTEKIEILAEKIMIDPFLFEIEEELDIENESEETEL